MTGIGDVMTERLSAAVPAGGYRGQAGRMASEYPGAGLGKPHGREQDHPAGPWTGRGQRGGNRVCRRFRTRGGATRRRLGRYAAGKAFRTDLRRSQL